jgi:hypothetical protein
MKTNTIFYELYQPQKIKDPKAFLYILGAIFAILVVPLLGLYVKDNGLIPSDFFLYPATKAPVKPPFNLIIACIIGTCFIVAAIFYIRPTVFGFKKQEMDVQKSIPKVAFPIWGWLGAIAFFPCIVLLWGHFSQPKIVLNWIWIPVFWGYTLLMDGWLYVRTGGKSMIKNNIKEVFAIGVSAMGGWMLFEYLNYFVEENWIYPCGDMIPDDEFLLYAIVGSSGLIPVIFVIYRLLNTFPNIKNKYANGPKVSLKPWFSNLFLLILLAGMFAISFYPNQLFGLLWVAPVAILAIVLSKVGLWTPFTGLKDGNWGPLVKYTLCYLIYGVSLECINYFSFQHLADGEITGFTPALWTYTIPYVSFWHVFEMPLVGYLGYLPFGPYCSVWWICFAYLLNIPTTYLEDEV